MAYSNAVRFSSHQEQFEPLAAGYYSFATGKTTWRHTDAEGLRVLLVDNPPEFRTILSRSVKSLEDLTLEEINAVRYAGSAYFDFDGESLEEVIPAFQSFLSKLTEAELDLEQVRLYASGGRGFHVEVPMACFMPTPPEGGIVGLPYIYREMANSLYVDCLDLNVYSAKLGRMWRVPNRQRDNGRYKVPLSVEEALGCTPESYLVLTSKPRTFPPLEPPCFCPKLGLIYSRAKDKLAMKPARKRSPQSSECLRRFHGSLPPSITALCQGRLPARGGWNRITMQLALTAQACGVSEDALVGASKRLIEGHVSDGGRYSTPSRRECELRRMYWYMEGNAAYQVSVGALRSILPAAYYPRDLRGL